MFDNRFEVFLADNPLGKTLHYRLRHQVYCEERGWEPGVEGEDNLEYDKYDENSVHFLVRSRNSGSWVAGLRLVRTPFNELPLSSRCLIDPEYCDLHAPSLSAELSRLFIVPDYRGGQYLTKAAARGGIARCGSVISSEGHASQNEIILGVLRAARDFCQVHSISGWYFLAARSLARKLSGLGVVLHPCGQEIEFRGIRRPYFGYVDRFFDDVHSCSGAAAGAMMSNWAGYRLFSELDAHVTVSPNAVPMPIEQDTIEQSHQSDLRIGAPMVG